MYCLPLWRYVIGKLVTCAGNSSSAKTWPVFLSYWPNDEEGTVEQLCEACVVDVGAAS